MTQQRLNSPLGRDVPSTKARLRREILDDFISISAEERRRCSQALADRFLALPEVQARPGPLMLFLSMADELDTDPLIEGALAAGLQVYAPHTKRRSRRLVPTQLHSLAEVTSGAYGIREPRGAGQRPASELALVVVPAVAYDRQGYRLGRGGGYYDRFLLQLSASALTCGVVFSRHLLEEVPREAHDQPVQLIVTEQEVLYPPGRPGVPD